MGEKFELGKAISMIDVIQNIKMKSDYYQKATLGYIADSRSVMAIEYLKRLESE